MKKHPVFSFHFFLFLSLTLINNKIYMSNTQANLLMLLATIIWGTAFVSQTTGMGAIGPFTFSFARFFFATLTVLPLAFYFEYSNFKIIFSNKKLIILSITTGFVLFL